MGTGGLSRQRHEVMAGHVERGHVPGLVTLIDRRGEVHVDAIGTLAFRGSAPIGRDTIFRIASLTKPITAAAAMMLRTFRPPRTRRSTTELCRQSRAGSGARAAGVNHEVP
jgi:hypothetical protein